MNRVRAYALTLAVMMLVLAAQCKMGRAQVSVGLLARDVNGFALDMSVQEVQAKAGQRLRPLGGGQFEVTLGRKFYNFGFSALGRLYRIDYEENLGNFIPDEAYGRTLTRKLTEKFGPPQSNSLPSGAAFWQFVGQCRTPEGQVLNCETESLSASLLGGWGSPIKLKMKLMDFQILRRDLAGLNANPRSQAEHSTVF